MRGTVFKKNIVMFCGVAFAKNIFGVQLSVSRGMYGVKIHLPLCSEMIKILFFILFDTVVFVQDMYF